MSHTDDSAGVIEVYDRRSPAVRTILTVFSTAVAVAVVSAIVLGLSLLMRDTEVRTSQVDMTGSAQLVINATTADLEIVEGEPDLLTVSSSVTSGLRQTDYQLGGKPGGIKIISVCQKWLNPGCGVKSRLQVPPGLPLVIKTTTGSVQVKKIASGGVLNVQTTDGSITATGLEVDEFAAQTDTGEVIVTFAEQPFGLKVATKSGDILAKMPDGKRQYVITNSSRKGEVSSAIKTSVRGKGLIRLTSKTGDVTLTTTSK